MIDCQTCIGLDSADNEWFWYCAECGRHLKSIPASTPIRVRYKAVIGPNVKIRRIKATVDSD